MIALKTSLLAAALLVAASASASAHDPIEINRTQSRQMAKIVQAWNSGQLTRREYYQLMAEQARIAQLQQNAQYSGNLNGRDYQQIREAQTEAGRHIWTESHDAEVNYWRAWKWRQRARF